MIFVNKGHVCVDGEPVYVLADFTCLIKNMRQFLAEKVGEENADRIIEYCGKLAYKSTEEIEREIEECMT